ncbi:hypothetical protein ACVDFE_02110 [Lentzea chajnantorensis]
MGLPRLLPPAPLVVQQVLQQLALPHLPGLQIGTQRTNVFSRVPFLLVQELPGGAEPHPELYGIASIAVEAVARGSVAAAADLAELARWALWRAVDEQVVVAAGHLTSYEVTERPVEIRDAGVPADVFQFRGVWSLGFRAN